jgi:phosphate transport system permease protein
MTLIQRRVLMNKAVMIMSGLAAAIGLFFLVWILGYVFIKGYGAINWSFFTQLPTPPGVEGGGLSSAIAGTLIMTALASLISVPIGIIAGTYLSEFGQNTHLGHTVRFLSDILVSAPSIVIGVFVYLVMVKPMGNFSGWAGGVSLAIIMLPVVTRTTEEMLRLVPSEMREAALALGAPYWHTMVRVVFRAATAGLLTGVLLAVARVSGETAPLLFTALNSPYWSNTLNQPMSNLTVTLFNYAMSPYDDWHAKAWGAAFLITASVLFVTITTRFILRDRSKR